MFSTSGDCLVVSLELCPAGGLRLAKVIGIMGPLTCLSFVLLVFRQQREAGTSHMFSIVRHILYHRLSKIIGILCDHTVVRFQIMSFLDIYIYVAYVCICVMYVTVQDSQECKHKLTNEYRRRKQEINQVCLFIHMKMSFGMDLKRRLLI